MIGKGWKTKVGQSTKYDYMMPIILNSFNNQRKTWKERLMRFDSGRCWDALGGSLDNSVDLQGYWLICCYWLLLTPPLGTCILEQIWWGTVERKRDSKRKRLREGRVSMRASERDRERARRQAFKIQFPGSEEANPASVIPCKQKQTPIPPSLPIIIIVPLLSRWLYSISLFLRL